MHGVTETNPDTIMSNKNNIYRTADACSAPEALIKAGVQGFASCLLCLCITIRHDRLDELYEHITQLILPEAVQSLQTQPDLRQGET